MKDLKHIIIESSTGLKAELTNFGARLMALHVPKKDGGSVNVCLGYDNPEAYLLNNENYFGAIIGRYCNRIAKGQFKLDGITYNLAKNNGPNHLHGGIDAFHNAVWETRELSSNAIEFRHISADGEEGYPGKLEIKLIYALVENELHLTIIAVTDKKTIVNMTAHPYFNLKGEGEGSVLDHLLMINADYFTPVDETLIPTGELREVEESPFDFRSFKKIGAHLKDGDEQLLFGNGYDHNYVLKQAIPGILDLAATVVEPESGLKMEIHSTEPGIQFYSANFLDEPQGGYSTKPYQNHGAFCLETQHFPDSPNKADFPTVILETGDKYHTKTVYKFSYEQ